jgi:6-phosphogluconolactonase
VSAFVYVSNALSNDISILRLADRSGELTLLDTVAVPGIVQSGGSIPMAVTGDRRFLYAAPRGQPLFAAGFAIDQTSGRLEHVASGALADNMVYIATDRSDRFLLGASYGGHKITVNPIEPDANVQAVQQAIATEPNAHCIVLDAANRYALSTSLGGDLVRQWRFDPASGSLSPNEPPAVRVQANAGPRHLVFHPDGRFVYLLNELDALVCVFAYQPASGRLAELQSVSALPPGFADKPWAADIHATPDGRFLYASERRSSTLACFAIDPGTGRLAQLGSIATEQQPRAFAIDPAGRYLLAAGELSDRMTSYAIDEATGQLSEVAQHPLGRRPNWIEIVNLS